jgi:hypothetical protein
MRRKFLFWGADEGKRPGPFDFHLNELTEAVFVRFKEDEFVMRRASAPTVFLLPLRVLAFVLVF